jgi:hypothetical protein
MDTDNEAWRSLWTLEMISRTAVHQSGVTAKVARSPNNPEIDRISLENTANLDLSRWDLGDISKQAMTLWLEGGFERLEYCRMVSRHALPANRSNG